MNLRFQSWIRGLKALGSLAFNLLQFIAASIAIITTSAGAAIIALLLHLQNWALPLFTFALGISMTLILVIFLFLKTSPPRWLLRGYRYVRAESLYTIHNDDPRHHSFTITIELEAIQPGVSIFEDRYLWTGRGQEGTPKVVSQGHTLMGEIIKRSGWKYYYIYLGHELSVGERTEVKTEQELYDLENKFEPYVAKTIAEPVDRLILHAVLPKDRLPASTTFIEWNTVGPASNVIRKMPGKINHQSGEILWEVQSPVFGHRYEIRWEY